MMICIFNQYHVVWSNSIIWVIKKVNILTLQELFCSFCWLKATQTIVSQWKKALLFNESKNCFYTSYTVDSNKNENCGSSKENIPGKVSKKILNKSCCPRFWKGWQCLESWSDFKEHWTSVSVTKWHVNHFFQHP